jgi:hypothetical protein
MVISRPAAASSKRETKAAIWRRRVGNWQRSGLGQAAFCRRYGLAVATFQWWRKRLGIYAGFSAMQWAVRRCWRCAAFVFTAPRPCWPAPTCLLRRWRWQPALKSPFHFSRRFKEVYGRSPRAFRAGRGTGLEVPDALRARVERLSEIIWGRA